MYNQFQGQGQEHTPSRDYKAYFYHWLDLHSKTSNQKDEMFSQHLNGFIAKLYYFYHHEDYC
jgi:hypothetical protein